MSMRNLFKDVKLGDLFLTRTGETAVYVGRSDFEWYPHRLAIIGRVITEVYTDDGENLCTNVGQKSKDDIIQKLNV
jgi:hypothetical protein